MTSPLHILLIDDEALARSRLQTLLADAARQMPDLPALIVQEADSAEKAWALLNAPPCPIELVLLDIHMPGHGGLSLASHMRSLQRPPALVFVTAHSLHAVQAFELDALDYLTKPVRLARLQQTLAKLMRQRQPAPQPEETLVIQERGRSQRILLAEVIYFKAELKYLTVRTASHSYILDSTLNELEARHAAQFVRIHRNALVARWALRTLEKYDDPQEGESWALRLQDIAEPLTVSRRQLASVRATLRGQAS